MTSPWMVPLLAFGACAVLAILLRTLPALAAWAVWQVRQRRLVREAGRYLKDRTP